MKQLTPSEVAEVRARLLDTPFRADPTWPDRYTSKMDWRKVRPIQEMLMRRRLAAEKGSDTHRLRKRQQMAYLYGAPLRVIHQMAVAARAAGVEP